jgi:hypothetical protein
MYVYNDALISLMEEKVKEESHRRDNKGCEFEQAALINLLCVKLS